MGKPAPLRPPSSVSGCPVELLLMTYLETRAVNTQGSGAIVLGRPPTLVLAPDR